MRVAVMLFRDQVAPRFGATRHAALIQVERGVELDRELIDLAGVRPDQIPDRLSRAGVDVLICGGIHPRFESRLSQLGVTVIGGIVGPVDQAVAALRAGELAPGPFRCHRPGGGGRGRHRFGAQVAGRSRRGRGGRG